MISKKNTLLLIIFCSIPLLNAMESTLSQQKLDQQLFDLAMLNYNDKIATKFENLLYKGANIHAKNMMHKTLLTVATKHNNTEFCKLLIKHGAKVITEDNRNTLSYWAVSYMIDPTQNAKHYSCHGAIIIPKQEQLLIMSHSTYFDMDNALKKVKENLNIAYSKPPVIGFEPLIHATHNCNKKLCELLLTHLLFLRPMLVVFYHHRIFAGI